MKYKFRNKTAEFQSINLIDGSAIIVSPQEEVIIDNWNIYKEEIERVKIFFDISLEQIISDFGKVREIIPERDLEESDEGDIDYSDMEV